VADETRPADDGIEYVADVDVLSEGDKCSCAASDDNPF